MKPCENFHNVLLPPRKRLLAGLKRQNWEGSASPESSSSTPWIEYSARLQNLLKSGPHMSPEEIAKAARSAAAAAAKASHAARAAAEEKAAVAAKAVAAAKDAMSLVSCFERQLRKKKKHVQVHKKLRIALPCESNGLPNAMVVCGVVNEAEDIEDSHGSYTHKASSFCSLKDDLKESSSSDNTHICPLRDGIASISIAQSLTMME